MATTLTVREAEAADTATERVARSRLPALVLALVSLGFVAMSTVIAVRTPAWEAADEPGHVQNIETIVGGNWYRMGPNAGTEAHQPPLYYVLFAGWQRAIGTPVRAIDPGAAALGKSSYRGVYLHHTSGDHSFLLWLRLPNVLLGLGTILLTALAIRQFSVDPWTPVVAASIVAMTPRFVFLSAFVTNDNLAIFLGALLTLFALRFIARPSAWRMVPIGITLGLLVVTKLSALPFVAVLIVLVLLQRSWLERGRLLLVALGTALVVSWWYLVQNYRWYGDPLARKASTRYLQAIGGLGTFNDKPYRVHDPLGLIVQHVPSKIFTGFWYRSGWNQFYWTWKSSAPLWILLAVSLVGLFWSSVPLRVLAALGAIVLVGLVSVWIVAFQTATYEARLAFTGLPALGGLAAFGTTRWKVPLRFALPVAGFIGVCVAMHSDVFAVRWH